MVYYDRDGKKIEGNDAEATWQTDYATAILEQKGQSSSLHFGLVTISTNYFGVDTEDNTEPSVYETLVSFRDDILEIIPSVSLEDSKKKHQEAIKFYGNPINVFKALVNN